MMTNHPITPPPELRQLWAQQAQRMDPRNPVAWQEHVATQAARWGSDQELEACRLWVSENHSIYDAKELKLARRPKPPSLKERALAALDGAVYMADDSPPEGISTDQADIIRRALEALPE